MKVESEKITEAAAQATKEKFCDVVKRATHAAAGKAEHAAAPKEKAPTTGPVPIVGPRSAVPPSKGTAHVNAIATAQSHAFGESRAAANKVAEGLHSARSEMHHEVSRLADVRAEAGFTQEQKVEGRVLDLIVNELAHEFRLPVANDLVATQPMTRAEIANVLGGPIKEQSVQNVPRVEDIAALVDQIRVFMKNNRPAMAVSVGGTLNAHVEIEKTGPKLVALKVIGRGALPKTYDINKIREGLAEKGIKVSVVEVALGK